MLQFNSPHFLNFCLDKVIVLLHLQKNIVYLMKLYYILFRRLIEDNRVVIADRWSSLGNH